MADKSAFDSYFRTHDYLSRVVVLIDCMKTFTLKCI